MNIYEYRVSMSILSKIKVSTPYCYSKCGTKQNIVELITFSLERIGLNILHLPISEKGRLRRNEKIFSSQIANIKYVEHY